MSIVEVAKAAGVSHSTVSRVINNRPGVSSDAVQAVHRAMQTVGYTPPARRRGPKPRDRRSISTGAVGLLMVGTDAMLVRAPVTAAVLHGAEQALAEQGFNMIVGQVGADGRMPPNVQRGKIDGLLLHGYAPPLKVRESLSRFPSVWLLSQRASRGYWGDRVTPDNESIGRLAAEHLFSRGHRRMAYLYFSATHMGFRARCEAFEETAEELGATVAVVGDQILTPRPFGKKEDFGVEETDAVVDTLLAMDPMPTGVFVPRDRLTVKLYRALRDRGVEPGRDLEVMSCDNEPILEALDPRPTSIDLRAGLIGRRAVTQLLWRLEHPNEPVRTVITVEPTVVPPTEGPLAGPTFNGLASSESHRSEPKGGA
ncbi:MAG: LacI family DNA-binding transcriptional regulator [Planctomycetota bacterium]